MNCREFQRDWDRAFDGEATPSGRDAHMAGCAECRDLDRGYRAFRQALATHAPPVTPSHLADRVLAEWGRGRGGRRVSRHRLVARSILVAAVAASVAFLAIARPWGRPSPAPRSLTGAMAKATSASLDLAREASAPAARIGRNVLAAGVPGEIAWPSSDNAPAVLASIGRRVGDGVRPLSGSARKAFGFLALPTSDRKTARPEG